MEHYAPNSLDLAPRDVVARSIETEIREGRGFDGGYVNLDLTHLGADRITGTVTRDTTDSYGFCRS